VHGAINLLDLAKRLGARIFQASTSEMHGDHAMHPQPESDRGNVNPIGIRACHDKGKRCMAVDGKRGPSATWTIWSMASPA
jgi:UDP-glucuronate decarboxylase